MEISLTAILSRILSGTLLPADYFRSLDCDAALDARDGDKEFDAAWIQLFEEVNRRWPDAAIEQEVRTIAEDIRRESFLAVSRATGQHEIASYVSDDFDLIVRAYLVGAGNPLPEQLWGVYERGEFPYPPL